MTRSPRLVRAGAVASVWILAAAAAAQQGASGASRRDLDVQLSVGGQYRPELDGRPAKFLEYREVPRGAVFELGRLDWAPRDSPWSLALTGRNALRDDQRYDLELRRSGRLRLQLGWRQAPHLFSSGAATLFDAGDAGTLTIPAALRAPLEAASPAALAGLVPGVLASSAAPIELASRREIGTAALSLTLARGVELAVSARREKRTGARALGFGTYIRRQAIAGEAGTGPGFFDVERIEPRGVEIPEPIDHRAGDLAASLSYSGARGVVCAGWRGSWFRNRVGQVSWDNPFEASPGAASAVTGIVPAADQEPPRPLGDNTLRGRYDRTSFDLWPDNDARGLFAAGTLRLGAKSRVNAAIDRGSIKQDDPFLPYAANAAVIFADPDGVVGSGDEVLAKDAALPAPDLAGEIRLTRASLAVSGEAAGRLRARASLRSLDYDDRSRTIFFPGYSSSGDSFMRRAIGQTLDGRKVLFNHVGGYRRVAGALALAYQLGRHLGLEGEYGRVDWRYDARQVGGTGENTFRLGARAAPLERLHVRAFVLSGSRGFDGSYDVGLETSGVRAFDVWRRNRWQFGGEAELQLTQAWSVGASASRSRDEFPGAVDGFPEAYGLGDTRSTSASAFVNGAWAGWSVAAAAGYEGYDWNSLQVTKTTPTSANYDPVNRWSRRQDDRVLWLNLAVGGAVTSRLRLDGLLQYNAYRGDWTTNNLAAPTVNSAVAYPFPEFEETLATVKVSGRYQLARRVDLEARYWYEPYRLTDFTWDLVRPYMQGVLQETGASPAAQRAANVSRLLWLDSRYSDYTAHVFTALLHLRF